MRSHVAMAVAWVVAADVRLVSAQDVRHPRGEFIIRPIPVTTELRFGVRAQIDSLPVGLLRHLADAGDTGRLLARIGVLDGGEPYVFGSIADAFIDSEGRIYALDDQLSVVRVFSPGGKFQYSLGNRGRGPGEFVGARAFALAGNGDVYVTDVTRRLHAFRKTATGHALGGSRNVAVSIDDLCVVGSVVISHSRPLVRNELIYVLNDSGQVLRAFGEIG